MHQIVTIIAVLLALVAPARATEPPDITPPIASGQRAWRDAAIVIGNEAYEALPQVTYADQDAHAFRDWLLYTRGLSRWRVRMATDATASTMLNEAVYAARRLRRGGTFWIYYSGHGTVSADGSQRVLVGADAPVNDLAGHGLALSKLADAISRYTRRAKRVVLVIDAGFGPKGRDGLDIVPGLKLPAPPAFKPPADNWVIWAATAGAEPAMALPAAKEGLFTWTVLGALRGWADGAIDGEPDGVVTFAEAQRFTTDTTIRLGHVTHPPIETRPDVLNWRIESGPWLEKSPDTDIFSVLGREDLQHRLAELETRVKSEASVFWRDTLKLAQAGGPQGKKALEAFIAEYGNPVVDIEWSIFVPEVAEARKVLAHYDEQGARRAVTSARIEPCDDLVSLEGPALTGQLSAGQQACLEGRLMAERLQTGKNRISRLLIVNAQMKGDRKAWEKLVSRHLEEIDRSDPDLCFSYAVYLYRTGNLDRYEEAIHWAGYALENKQNWQGEEYVKKVNALFRLRAQAAARLWRNAVQKYTTHATPDNEAAAIKYRGMAKDYAREWLDYARASNGDTALAYQMCLSAAGTREACEVIESADPDDSGEP